MGNRMKVYELVAPNNEIVADHLFKEGYGEVWNWEVLETLIRKLHSKGFTNVEFIRKDIYKEVSYNLEEMRACIREHIECRPMDEDYDVSVRW